MNQVSTIGPEYQRVEAGIRASIIAGDYPIGKPIPSTRKLEGLYGASSTVVRRAVIALQAARILEGHAGKGVFVIAVPQEDGPDSADDARALAAMRDDVSHLQDVVDGLQAAVADDITSALGRLEVNLMNLYSMTGHDYPHGAEAGERRQAAAHGKLA